MFRPAGDSDTSDGFSDGDEGYSDKSVDVTRADDPKKTATLRLRDAARDGHVDDVERILKERLVHADAKVDGDWTPLMHAAMSSHPDVVSALLERGADANACVDGYTPLSCACASDSFREVGNAACVRRLLAAGARPEATDPYGQTPLMKAAKAGKALVVAQLLPHVDVDAPNTRGETAAFYAVDNNRSEVLELLIEHGADLHVKNKHRESLADIAKAKNDPEILALLKDVVEEKEKEEEECYRPVFTPPSEDWREAYPSVCDPKKQLYSSDIAYILYGMNCERLIQQFADDKVELSQLLSLDSKDMEDLNVQYPYLMRRLAIGLRKFHTHNWSNQSIIVKRDHKDLPDIATDIGSHLKHITIILASVNYIRKMIVQNSIPVKQSDLEVRNILAEIPAIEQEIRKLRIHTKKINKRNIPPGDLILSKPDKPKSSKKKTVFLIILSVTCAFTIAKFHFR